MVSTWIESPARGRQSGPVRAGMWSAVVVGTHPAGADARVWLEVTADDGSLGPLPAFHLEDRGPNSLWHAPIPPQAVGARLRYRSAARRGGDEPAFSPYQEVVVRPNLPDRTETVAAALGVPEGLVGNRRMTVKVDARGSTYDVYFPTVGLHSDVRPSEGDLPQSRSHFRAIVGGLAAGRRLDWFAERLSWESYQHYQGATNLLVTDLRWRHGPIRVIATDLVAAGPDLPKTAGGSESPGQYLKRFRIRNEGPEPRRALFGVYIHAEVNGGVGEPGLRWLDEDRALLATNRGHAHTNRKLARDATVEFALALDGRGEVQCEPTGPEEAVLLRWVDLPAGGEVAVDLLVSGAFTGWRGDQGTFEHWLRPALAWFRGADRDQVERETEATWDQFVEPLPTLNYPEASYGVGLRRSALAAALHSDALWGAFASGFDRGLNAYCWPRDALWAGAALTRAGHPEIGRGVFTWLAKVRDKGRPYLYWFQKYTIDGSPEWETPAIDQTAMIPWALLAHYRRTGDADLVEACWPSVEQAAAVCAGESGGHPGLKWLDDLGLISSSGLWGHRFGAFLFGNVSVVAGLRAAAELAERSGRGEKAGPWRDLADRVWERGVLATTDEAAGGLVDPASGRFLDARRLSTLRGLWTDRPEALIDRSAALDISLLSPAIPFGLLPANDPRVRRAAVALLRHNVVRGDPNALACWAPDPSRLEGRSMPGEAHRHDASSLATLWMARYLLQLGRETGEGKSWTRALALVHDVLGRLGPLSVGLRPGGRRDGMGADAPRPATGVWGLHALMIETLLDLGGLDYDAIDRRLVLAPILPPAWPSIGLSRPLPCGDVSYSYARPHGRQERRLVLEARLDHPVRLDVQITCPGLMDPGAWSARPETPPPSFDRASGRVAWSVELPGGTSRWEWAWGGA